MLEENKAVVRRFYGLFELGDTSSIEEIVAADYIDHSALPGQTRGLDGLKEFVSSVKAAFSDIQFRIEDQIAEGDKVVTQYTASGTHQGALLGIPASGKQVKWTATSTMTVAGGKIREFWLNWDQWGLMQQLGVVPLPGGSS